MTTVQTFARKELGVPEKNSPDTASPGIQRQRDRAIDLVGEWLATHEPYNTVLTYSTAIGYPYTPSGKERPRPYSSRTRLAWLAWCAEYDVNPIRPSRGEVEEWWTEVNATTLARDTRLLLARALSAFSKWAVRHNHTNIDIGAWIDQSTAA